MRLGQQVRRPLGDSRRRRAPAADRASRQPGRGAGDRPCHAGRRVNRPRARPEPRTRAHSAPSAGIAARMPSPPGGTAGPRGVPAATRQGAGAARRRPSSRPAGRGTRPEPARLPSPRRPGRVRRHRRRAPAAPSGRPWRRRPRPGRLPATGQGRGGPSPRRGSATGRHSPHLHPRRRPGPVPFGLAGAGGDAEQHIPAARARPGPRQEQGGELTAPPGPGDGDPQSRTPGWRALPGQGQHVHVLIAMSPAGISHPGSSGPAAAGPAPSGVVIMISLLTSYRQAGGIPRGDRRPARDGWRAGSGRAAGDRRRRPSALCSRPGVKPARDRWPDRVRTRKAAGHVRHRAGAGRPGGPPGLTSRAEPGVDTAGPGWQASQACPPARDPAPGEGGGRSAPEVAIRDPRHSRDARFFLPGQSSRRSRRPRRPAAGGACGGRT